MREHSHPLRTRPRLHQFASSVGGRLTSPPSPIRTWGDCQAELKRLHIELPADVQRQLEAGAANGTVECVFK